MSDKLKKKYFCKDLHVNSFFLYVIDVNKCKFV